MPQTCEKTPLQVLVEHRLIGISELARQAGTSYKSAYLAAKGHDVRASTMKKLERAIERRCAAVRRILDQLDRAA